MLVGKIKELCASRGITIKELERTTGLGNGTIRRWDDSSPALEKVIKVADYFDISVDMLTGSENKFDFQLFAEKNPALENENGITDIQKMAIDFIKTLSDEQLERYINMGTAAFGEMDN